MTPPVFDGTPLAVALCGDDPGALERVRSLVADLGCDPVDGGGLERGSACGSAVPTHRPCSLRWRTPSALTEARADAVLTPHRCRHPMPAPTRLQAGATPR